MSRLPMILIVILVCLMAGLAHGQVASVLFIEDAPLPNAPEFTTGNINNPDVNGPLGWCFTVTASDQAGQTISLAYGTLLGGAPGVIRTEQAFDDYVQDSWESFFGMADADVCYSPSCTRTSDGEGGLDSVWFGDDLVAIEEEAYPHLDGWYWRFGSRPGVTRDGVPYFVGGITDSQGGATQVRGLFYGPDGAPVIIGGMAIAGLPDPVVTNTSAVSFDFRFSAYGSHLIAEVDTDTGDTAANSHVVMDGAVVMAGGLPLSEGGVIPESMGGLPGEMWDNWDYLGVTETGHWLVTGDTNGPTTQDEFLMVDGEIILREGDLVDGMALTGGIERAYLGEDGDWVCVWDVVTDDGNMDAMILNGAIVLMQGMPVDFDGDGVTDPAYVVNDFTGMAAVAVAERDAYGQLRVLFSADIEVPDAMRRPAGVPELADEESGRDSDVVEEMGSRAELEVALMLTTEATVAIEDDEEPDETPATRLALAQNFPNPFNPMTKIVYSVPDVQAVRLAVYDLQGRSVRTLVNGVRSAGDHEVMWDGADDLGRHLASGAYVYRLETEGRLLTRNMVLLK